MPTKSNFTDSKDSSSQNVLLKDMPTNLTQSSLNGLSTKKNNKPAIVIIGIVLLLVLASGAYYYYKQSQTKTTSAATNNSPRNGGGNRGGSNMTISGTIISTSDKQITVEDSSGNQKIIVLSDTTRISKVSTSTKVDVLKADQYIMATTANGSTTASKVTATDTPQIQNGGQGNPGGNARADQNPQNGGGQGRPNSPNGNPGGNRGKITSFTDSEIAITGFNNNTSKVAIDANTQYFKQTTLDITAVTKDSKVDVSTSTSGSVLTARSILIQ